MRTYPHQPKCDAALRHAQHTHDFAIPPARLAEISERIHTDRVSAMAESLGVERQQVYAALLQAGLCLCEVRPWFRRGLNPQKPTCVCPTDN